MRLLSRSARLVAIISLTFVCGCATLLPQAPVTREEEQLVAHYILIHEEGYPFRVVSGTLWNSREALQEADFKTWIGKILEGLARRAAEVAAKNEPLRILLFAHGGLNSYRSDYERMRSLMAAGSGSFAKSSYYPIFINWNSALIDSIVDDVFFIRQGRRNLWTGPITAPFVLAGKIANSALGAPKAWLNSLDNFFERLRNADADGEAPQVGAQDVLWNATLLPIKAVEIPVLETFGTGAWQIMRRRAELAVASRLVPSNATDIRQGAARILVRELEGKIDQLKKQHANLNVEVTLVGHSMGAMLVNRIISFQDNLNVKNIIYLAPASRIDDFEQIALPFLETRTAAKPPASSIWWFSLSRTDEAKETHFFRVTPDGTLLVWIDNYFEPLGTQGQATFGRARNLEEYYGDWLKKPDDHGLISFSPQADPDFAPFVGRKADIKESNEPREHGGFDDAEIFTKILCRVDRAAFTNPRDCDAVPTGP
jgi:pimeloyl-ACP methyl ester carboxylesterase